MNTLQSFVDRFNSSEPADLFLSLLDSKFTEVGEKRKHIGVSQLGYPAVITAFKKLHPDLELAPPLKAKLRMHFGNLMEQSIIQIMKHYGSVTNEQDEVNFEGVPGHLDGVWENCVVFDIKMMSDNYYSWFTKTPNDNRGYLTQIGCYAHCTNLEPAIICINSSTFEMALVRPQQEILEGYVERAANVASVLHTINSVEDIIGSGIEPPPPEAEVFKKELTGNYLVPTSMKYTAIKDCCYMIEKRINGYKVETEYVIDIYNLEQIVQNVETMLKDRVPF